MVDLPQGYALWWKKQYCLLISTGGREDGTNDIYLHSVGAETHQHMWFHIIDGQINNGGVRMKDRGVHIGPNKPFQGLSTQAFAKTIFEWDPETSGVNCQLSDIFQQSTFSATISFGRTHSKRQPRRVDLPYPLDGDSAEYLFSLFDINTSPSTHIDDPNSYILRFGGDCSIGVIISRTA